MTRIVRNWLGISTAALALVVATTMPATSQAPVQGASAAPAQSVAPAAAPAATPDSAAAAKPSGKSSPKRVAQAGTGHVYLLRGLLNIFSLGMDDLAAKIQAKGISASVHNHSEWQGLADDIAAKYKAGRHGPVILVGHSLGADAVMYMGEYLGKKGVPVALVVPFDGTGSFAASSNVQRVMNLTQRDYAYMRKGNGFRGELSNIDVSNQAGIDHINIDKSARLHGMVLTRIQSVLGRGGGGTNTAAPRPRPAEGAPTVPAAAPAESAPAPAPKPQAGVSTSGVSTSGLSTERAVAPRPAAAPAAGDAARPAVRF